MSDGWRARVTTMDATGRPALFRHFLVFEGDKERAVVLVRMHLAVSGGETIELLAPLDRETLRSHRLKPGDVKEA
jgi:hypothetical protein